MRNRIRRMAVLLGIIMVFTFMPSSVYADTPSTSSDNADFYGGAISLVANERGELIIDAGPEMQYYVIFHSKNGDKQLDFVYTDLFWNHWKLVDHDNPREDHEYKFICDDQYEYANGKNKVSLSIEWGAVRATIDNADVHNDVSSISFEPSNITLNLEDIKSTYNDDGYVGYTLPLRMRSTHSHEGKTWHSPYELGDKIIVNYASGSTKEFVCKDYYDEEYRGWTTGFFCGDEKITPVIDTNHEFGLLDPGVNNIAVEYHGRRSAVTVLVEESPSYGSDDQTNKDTETNDKVKDNEKKSTTSSVLINKPVVSAANIKKAAKLGVTEITLGPKVKKINKNAFKGTRIRTVTLKTKKLKSKSVKGSLKGSKVKKIKVKVGKAKINKKYVKAYKKIFTKKNAGKKVSVK